MLAYLLVVFLRGVLEFPFGDFDIRNTTGEYMYVCVLTYGGTEVLEYVEDHTLM